MDWVQFVVFCALLLVVGCAVVGAISSVCGKLEEIKNSLEQELEEESTDGTKSWMQ